MTFADVVNITSRCYYALLTARCNSVVLMTLCGMCALFSLTEALTQRQQEAAPVKQSQSRLRLSKLRSFLFWVAATAVCIALDIYVFAETDLAFHL